MSTVALALPTTSLVLLFLSLYPTALQAAKLDNSIRAAEAQDGRAARKVSGAQANAMLQLQRSETSVWIHRLDPSVLQHRSMSAEELRPQGTRGRGSFVR